MSATPRTQALRHFLPEPSRLWIRHVPASWPAAGGWWTHLAERSLGAEQGGDLPAVDAAGLDDVVYLPPVPSSLRRQALTLAEALEAAGARPLRQVAVGDGDGRRDDILDPLAVLLEDGAAGLADAPGCATAVWPLVPGLTDRPADWEVGLAALRAAGVECVVPLALELDPAARRRLAGVTDEAGYQALFHGPPADERACARAVAAAGLRPFATRPEQSGPPRRTFARQVVAELAQAAELWLRLRRTEAAGQELLRAARWVERTDHDLRALAREGNLAVLPWLDARSRALVSDLAAAGHSRLLAELEDEYLGGER
jgi:hypothetical protein